MQSKTVTIPNITCGHCVMTVENEVKEIAGVAHVQANQKTQQATIEWDEPASWDQIVATLKEINYPPEGENLIQL